MSDLTKAQLELLREADNIDGMNCAEYYPPAKALVAKGYAEWLPRKWSSCLRATDAGRRALIAQQAKP